MSKKYQIVYAGVKMAKINLYKKWSWKNKQISNIMARITKNKH